jgi:hypothetical protein
VLYKRESQTAKPTGLLSRTVSLHGLVFSLGMSPLVLDTSIYFSVIFVSLTGVELI